jgi:DNA-directed RNA polymerase specialized sigma24 family protein
MDAPHDLLESLLTASGPEPRSNAWAAFLSRYSAALLHAARSMGGDHDLVMDRYAFIVEALERDDFRRLRIYLTEGRGAFTTWLLVVARRLCLDHHRHRYGRLQSDGPAAIGRRTERKRLADLLGDELGFLTLPSGGEPSSRLP